MGEAPVLLVDDDAAVRTALKFALEIDGYEVETFADAESLAARPRFPANGCLVVDHQLPGMSGLALVEALRARDVALPALLITSHPTAEMRRRACAAKAAIVEKPLLAGTLGEAVARALQLKGSSGP